MTFKSTTQPLCRYCGAPIRKYTHTVYFGRRAASTERFSSGMTEKPADRAAAQRLLNQTIVSSRWSGHFEGGKPFVAQVSTWDGESYVDQFFCTGSHAQDFAYVMARAGHQTKDHAEAVEARKEKA